MGSNLKTTLLEFTDFIREKGVVGMAVGVITGSAVSKTVTSIVENLFNPLMGAISGTARNLADLAYTIPLTKITFNYGAVLSSLVNLIIVLLVVYLIFVKSPLKKIDKKKA